MQKFSTSPLEVFTSVLRARGLALTLTKRELAGRYKGSVLGVLWSLIIPIFMLSIYTVVFSGVFKSRWGSEDGDTKAHFALILFAGLLVFNFFSECVNRGPSIILSNPNLVKKVVFPLEVLAWVTLGSALFNAAISFCILVIAQGALYSSVPWTVVLFPFVILPLALMALGLMWFLSSLAVYIRDVAQVTGLLTTALLFISAVFFPLSAFPERYRWLIHLNPVAVVVDWSRGVLVLGEIPAITAYLSWTFVGLVTAYLGFYWFQKSRKGFADVI